MYLALDQSPTKIGFALGEADARPFVCGRIPVIGRNALQTARTWLRGTIVDHAVSKVIFEMPIAGGGNSNFERSTQANCELIGVIKLVCLDHGIVCEGVGSQTWRKHFVGMARAPREIRGLARRRRWIKDEVARACCERRWDFHNDDESDALGILDWALCKDFPQFGAEQTPLLRVGAA